jgi:uncharacterized protein YkvS
MLLFPKKKMIKNKEKVMKMELKIGQKYRVLPIEFKNEIVGEIMKIYENTVIVLAEEYDKKDRVAILDKHQRVLVKKENVLDEVFEKVS